MNIKNKTRANRWPLPLVALLVGLSTAGFSATPIFPDGYIERAQKRLATRLNQIKLDEQSNGVVKGGVLFAGSSTIQRWKSLAADFAPLPVVNRGLSGSTMREYSVFIDDLVIKYQPKVIVVYEGDNDLGPTNATLEIFTDWVQYFHQKVRASLPDARMVFLSIKPSVRREGRWDLMDKANQWLAQFAAQDPKCSYVDVGPLLRDESGKVRPELFEKDGLHLNADGYARWATKLRPAVFSIAGEVGLKNQP